jgi:acetyl-CoA/propionyl-CoA carboxylase biotin carboxyl carrier protein
VEESPAPGLDPKLRERIGAIGVEAARAVGYRSAGTIEGLLQDGDYFFLEMNTRVQVEHGVTELVTGVDIVREQIRVAAGEPLSVAQVDVAPRGHAIECRINLEDASRGFVPSPGRILEYREPGGPGVRVDSGVEAGTEVSPLYDPLVAKLLTWDVDRPAATRRMRRALAEWVLTGPASLLPFHLALLDTDQWRRGETCRDLVEDRKWLAGLAPAAPAPAARDDGAAPAVERLYAVEVSGRRFDVRVIAPAAEGAAGAPSAPAAASRAPRRRASPNGAGPGGSPETLRSPLQGTVLRVAVEDGAEVVEGDLVCVIEAMKMENEITAHRAGTLTELGVSEGASVSVGDTIAVIS